MLANYKNDFNLNTDADVCLYNLVGELKLFFRWGKNKSLHVFQTHLNTETLFL